MSFLTTPSFHVRSRARSIFGWRKVDTPILGLLRFLNQLGDMQQRFRRNAAAVEAYAAGIHLGIDQRNLHAEIGGEERGSVSARSAADYSDSKLLIHFGISI